MTTTRADVDSASTPNAIDTVTDAELERLLVDAGAEPVLLYFTTPWCGPCQVFGPQLNAFVTANPGTVRVLRVDADESPAAADRFRVHAFPTLTMVRAGEQLWLRAGALSEQELSETLPALSVGARAITDDEMELPTEDDIVAAPSAPRSVTVPQHDDPRVTVWNGREKLQHAQVVRLGEGEALRVGFTSDVRLSPSCDLVILREFPPGAVDTVVLRCSDLTPDHIGQLAALPALASLSMSSTKPLREDVVAAMSMLDQLRHLYIDAPDLDAPALRRALPGAMVNFDWTAPQLSARLPRADRTESAKPPGMPQVRLADPGQGTVIALAEHRADPVPGPVLTALAHVPEWTVAKVSDLDNPTVQEGFRFVGRSELLLVHRGRVLARRDTCGAHHVDELVALAGKVHDAFGAGREPSRRPKPQREERVIALNLRDEEAWLIPPNTTHTDWAALRPDEPQLRIPAGWSLLVRTALTDARFDALPYKDIDVLELRLDDDSDPAAITRLRAWPRLDELTVVMPVWHDEAVAALAHLTNLGRLVVMAQAPDEVDLASLLRAALPETVVNNEWTHPALRPASTGDEASRNR
jgi:thiol-disulfide isomerase/thioredoxin